MEHDDNDDNVEGKITTTTTWDSDLEDFTIIEKDETDEVFFFIPDEMLIRVFAFLQGKELCEVISLVCRHWKAIAEDDYLWFVMVKKELIKEYVEKEQKKRGIEIEDIKQKEKIEQEEKETADNITENIKEFLAIPLNLFCPIPGTSTSGDTENNNNEETENLIEKKDLDEDNKNNLQSISEHKNIEDEDAPEQVVKIEIDYDLIEKKLRFIKPKSRTWKWVYKSKTNLFPENPNKTKVTGVGKYIWDTNASYEGEWKDGAPNGMGMKYWEEQEYYVGSWISGKMNGYGFYSWEDGASYSGYWRDGFHEGEGIYIWADGNKYEGGWKRSTRNGWGVRTWIDGDIFSGEWVDGKRTGKGTYAWPNGSKYVGDWVSGSHEGQGSYSWLDGRKYSGGWVNSKKEGWGMYYWGDGCVFEGEWKNGQRNGFGKMVWESGFGWEGTWAGDRRMEGTGWDDKGNEIEIENGKRYDNYFVESEVVWELKYRADITKRRLLALERLKNECVDLPLPIKESKVLDPEDHTDEDRMQNMD